MNLTTSLELSKQLKEEGVPQKSLWYWIDEANDGDWEVETEDHWETVSSEWGDGSLMSEHTRISAFVAEEIGRWLPWRIEEPKTKLPGFLRIGHSGGGSEWYVQYIGHFESERQIDRVGTTSLTEVMGEMLLYLLRQGIIRVEDLK